MKSCGWPIHAGFSHVCDGRTSNLLVPRQRHYYGLDHLHDLTARSFFCSAGFEPAERWVARTADFVIPRFFCGAGFQPAERAGRQDADATRSTSLRPSPPNGKAADNRGGFRNLFLARCGAGFQPAERAGRQDAGATRSTSLRPSPPNGKALLSRKGPVEGAFERQHEGRYEPQGAQESQGVGEERLFSGKGMEPAKASKNIAEEQYKD